MPLLAFAVVLTAILHQHERVGRERALRDTARALSLAVDRELQTHVATLEALATSIHLDRPEAELELFQRDATRVLRAQTGWWNVAIHDRSGRQLAAVTTTRMPADETRALVRGVAASGRPSVSDLRTLPYEEATVITVSVPVVRDGRIRYVLTADVPPVQIGGLLQEQHFEDWLAAIIDRRGRTLARSRGADRLVGGPVNADLRQRLLDAPEGAFRGSTLDSPDGFTAYSRTPLSGWTVAIMAPPDDLLPSARRSLAGLIGLGLCLGGVAVTVALLLGRRVATSMAELSGAAGALGRGDAPRPVTSTVEEVNAVAAAMHEAGRRLAQRDEDTARAQATLHEREERLRLALTAGQMVTWDWDLRTGVVTWGDEIGLFRRDGCPRDAEPGDVFRFVHREDRAILRDTLDRAVKDGAACEAEFRVLTASRERGWVALRGRAFVDARGAPLRMLGVAMDITARKRAEQDAVALAAIVQSSDDAIVGETLQGHVESWNEGAERIYGYTAEEMKGRSVAVLFPEPRADEVPALLRRVAAGEHVEERDAVRVRKDGTRIDVSVVVSPIRDATGRIVKAATIARDVTAQRRTERRLAALQTLTDAALSHSSLDELVRELLRRLCGVLECDVASILLVAEDGQHLVVRASHGFEDEEGLVLPIGGGVVGRVAAERRPTVVEDLSAADVDNPMLRKRGVTSLLGVPLLVDDRVIGVVHVATVAARRFTEDETRLMLLAADRMALAIDHARLFEAERAARADAEAANRTKDQFLATLSHELRTPLTSMLGWLRMLRSGRLDATMAARALETLERSTRTQAQLINDLLDVSRIVSGKLTLDLGSVDADDVVAAAVEAARPLAEAKSISVTHARAGRAAMVHGDAGRLEQVVWNLLSNAIKFTPDSGRVAVEVAVREAEVRIAVTDTGKGIAPELLPQIFERFRQAAPTRRQGGLGLGLAIVRHLAEIHGGRVAAASDGPGRGARFEVYLPLADVMAVPRTDGGQDFPRLSGVRVLVVDDEPDARALMGTVLEQCGADVATVASSTAALEALRSAHFDVLLSDISMPEEDGYQLIRKVRAMQPEIPAAAVTAFARAEDREAALAAGFQLHVAKPVEPATLARVVESLVRRAA